jgi:hypothetical protein
VLRARVERFRLTPRHPAARLLALREIIRKHFA